MTDIQSLSHSVWDCKYHLVWIPKYRKKALFGQLRRHLGGVLHAPLHGKRFTPATVSQSDLIAFHPSLNGLESRKFVPVDTRPSNSPFPAVFSIVSFSLRFPGGLYFPKVFP